MSMKPLVLWAAHRQWRLRFATRTPAEASGVLTTPDGPLDFRYERLERRIHLPHTSVLVDEYGWEVDETGATVFRSQPPRTQTEPTHD